MERLSCAFRIGHPRPTESAQSENARNFSRLLNESEYTKVEFDRIDGEVKALGKLFSGVGNALQSNPGRFIFSNASGLPMEASLSRDSRSADSRDWRNVDQIMELLQTWHTAKGKMEGAWSAIPPDRQRSLVAPPTVRVY